MGSLTRTWLECPPPWAPALPPKSTRAAEALRLAGGPALPRTHLTDRRRLNAVVCPPACFRAVRLLPHTAPTGCEALQGPGKDGAMGGADGLQTQGRR